VRPGQPRASLGPHRPLTAQSLHDLATLLRDQSDPTAARPLFVRALAIRERVLGPDHPDTVATRRALAELAAGGDGWLTAPSSATPSISSVRLASEERPSSTSSTGSRPAYPNGRRKNAG
jgi:hypothetical protein